MSFNSSWLPDEDPQVLLSERCWLQGAIFGGIAYGITVALYFLTFHLLVYGKNYAESKKHLPLVIYITSIFVLGNLFMFTVAAFAQMAFIDNRNYPGGPSAFERVLFSLPVGDVGNAAFVLSNWLSDAFVVWRFKVVYQSMSSVPTWAVMLFPSLMLVGSVALGIMFLIQVSTTNPYVGTYNTNFTLPYLSLSLALNIILTIAIVLRLLIFRYRIVSVMGPTYGTHYTSISAVIIESAALYSAVSIAFILLFGIGSAVSQVFMQFLSQSQTIAALLIVYRVAQGKAWKVETASYMMTQRSQPPELHNIRLHHLDASNVLAGSEGTVNNYHDATKDGVDHAL